MVPIINREVALQLYSIQGDPRRRTCFVNKRTIQAMQNALRRTPVSTFTVTEPGIPTPQACWPKIPGWT